MFNTYTNWEFSVFNDNVGRWVECNFNDPDENVALRRISLSVKKDSIVTVSRMDTLTVFPFITLAKLRVFDVRITGYNSYEKIRLHMDGPFRLTKKSWKAIGVYGTLLLTMCFILL